jgi:ribose transport system substrate-binding protein
MRINTSFLGGVAAAAVLLALSGCDPNKGGGAPAAGPGAPAPSASSAAAPATSLPFEKPRKSDGAITVKVITNGNAPFWDAMGTGFDAGKKEAGIAGDWTAPRGTDNNSQKDTFEQAVAANMDGIAVSVIDAAAFAPVIDGAIAKGIPVLTFDSDAPVSKRLAYIGTNNFDAGVTAGRQAVKLFPHGGSLVAFVGNMSADNAKQRYQGFLDAVKGHNITMLQDPFEDNKDNKDSGLAHRNVADAITKYGSKVNGLLGLYSYDGPAIVDEVKKAGMIGKIKILCFDGEQRTLEFLDQGLVDVTVVQKPYEFGRLSALLLTAINRKGLTAGLQELKPLIEKDGMKLDMGQHKIDTGVVVITRANAKQFIQDLHAKGLKST